VVPWVRGFKIADDESPAPLDRVYFSFDYFDDVNDAANRARGIDLHDVRVYRETFGREKNFLDSAASVGLRLPLDTLTADSNLPALTGSSTDLGDLSVILKAALLRDPDTASLLSVGLAVTFPTGADAFARAGQAVTFHNTALQPFLGYPWNQGDFYLQGFCSLDVPTDTNDVTILHDDVGAGYWVYRQADPGLLLTGIAPALEVHVNTPLNHRGVLHSTDPACTPDVVDLTAGASVELHRGARLAVGLVAPVTGPRPFNVEGIAQLRLNF
jgi:hypothetical protein